MKRLNGQKEALRRWLFHTLREKGLKATLGEWLTLQEALEKGLCGSSLTQFYYVARMILVKSDLQNYTK